MYLRYFIYLFLWLSAMLLGPIGYLIARYVGIGYSIYGNDIDSWDGDDNYKNNQAKVWYRRLWPDWWWSVVRNPAHNLAKNILPAIGTLNSCTKHGNLTIAVINNKKYFFYYNEGDKYLVKFGWKLWTSNLVPGQRINAEFVFNP